MLPETKTIGVDGCRAGWIAVWQSGGEIGFDIYATFPSLWSAHSDAGLILVDMPIGLTRDVPRKIESQIRSMLGRKSSSVFPVPCLSAIYANDYRQACETNQQYFGKKISLQSWNICHKIREINDFLTNAPEALNVVGESHPELVFSRLNGDGLISSKKNALGQRQRMNILNTYLPSIKSVYPQVLRTYLRKDVARDDILDAIALLVTSRNAMLLQEVDQVGDSGIPVRMFVPALP